MRHSNSKIMIMSNKDGYYPRQAVWEMTLRCNMKCLHCGSRAGSARNDELTLEECKKIANQLIDMGLEQITLIGGEIFTLDFWHIIARQFVDNGVDTNIITNAYLLGDKQLRQIEESGIDMVGISIDGTEETHNHIRGKNDSFEKAIRALDILKDKGYQTSVVTTVMNLNIDQLEDLYNILLKHRVDAWQIQLATPMGNASDNNLLIEPNRVKDIIDFIIKKRRENKMVVVPGDDVGYHGETEEELRGYPGEKYLFNGCGAGLFVVGIDSVGNVRGCESLNDERFIEGNLREESLEEIWNKEGAFSYNRDFSPDKLTGKCKGCEMGKYCAGGCRQMCYFTSGEYYNNKYCVR